MKNPNSKFQIYSIAIKIIILILLVFALYKQLFAHNQLIDVLKGLEKSILQNGYILFLLTCILMFCNWGLEALKWQLIVVKLNPINFFQCYKAVWTGVTLGLFTPNRIGEYGGRILYVPRKFRIQVIVASLIGSYSQILITLFIGIVSLLFFMNSKLHVESFVFMSIAIICILLLAVLVLLYYNLDVLINILKRRKFFKRIQTYLNILNAYSYGEYNKFLLLSLLRYATFTAQYLIFLRLFGVSLNISNGIILMGIIFLAQTVLPSFAIAEVLTRGNIAVYFLTYYSQNNLAALAASTSLWLLNLIIPAILGYIFIIRYNFFKNKKT